MKTFFKAVGWILLGLVGLFIWFEFPAVQPIVQYGAIAGLIYWYVTNVLKETIVVPLASRIHDLEVRLERLESKVTVLLEDAYNRRRAGY